MRYASLPGLPGRCGRCFLPQALCLCEAIPQVQTKTRFTIVRHSNEDWKSTNTARLAALAMPQARLISYGDRDRSFREEALELEGACVLFPEGQGTERPPIAPQQVIVLDGTWAQARRMLQRIPALRTLPRLALPPRSTRAIRRLRQAHAPHAMSTLEAIAGAVALLEGEESGRILDDLYVLFVHRVLQTRGEA